MKFGYKISKMTRQVSFGEDINRLVGKGDGEQLEIAFLEMLASDVTVDFNVLSAFMEDIVMSNIDSTSKPNKHASGVSKGMILSLGTRIGNHILLLAMS